MKKNLLLAMSLMLSASGLAQTTLWDGESDDERFALGSRGGCWDDGAPTVVENPETDGINPSAKCLHFKMTDGSKVIKIPFRDWTKPSMDGSRRVSLMIKKSTDENLQIEISDPTNGTAGYWEKVAAWYGGGGQWQKVVFDFSANPAFDCPGVISITAQTGGVDGEQDVYIDNVVLEPATRANGLLLSEIEDGSLTGDVTLTGAWMKGDCQNADGEWLRNDYDDFGLLSAKLGAGATSIDMRGTVLKDAYNAFAGVNPNIVVFSDVFFEGDNVVVCGDGNRAERLVLDPSHPFAIPTGFDAGVVELRRVLDAGYSTLYVPFFVSQADLGAESIATFEGYSAAGDDGDEAVVMFTVKNGEGVAANTPMLVTMAAAAVAADGDDDNAGEAPEVTTFYNKYVTEMAAGDAPDQCFFGTYAPMSGEGLWGVTGQSFQKGDAGSRFNSFSACLSLPSTMQKVRIYDATTGIAEVNAADGRSATAGIYTVSGVKMDGARHDTLARGIYIINGKKVVVK